ncbi:MAG TPA: hypothetical protein VFP69_10835 [Streptomyces sp.]|nr:hypothetical protein [Streptomyces sp.]
MITHQPTREQLERLEQARLAASHTDTAVAEARAHLARALAEHAEAQATLTKAMDDVLYSPSEDNGEALPDTTHSNAHQPRGDFVDHYTDPSLIGTTPSP